MINKTLLIIAIIILTGVSIIHYVDNYEQENMTIEIKKIEVIETNH